MEYLFVLLFLMSLVALIIGLIAPRLFSWLLKKHSTRAGISITFGAAVLLFFILTGVTASDEISQNSSVAPEVIKTLKLKDKKNYTRIAKKRPVLNISPSNIISRLERAGFSATTPRQIGALNDYGYIYWVLHKKLKNRELTVELYGDTKNTLYAIDATARNYAKGNVSKVFKPFFVNLAKLSYQASSSNKVSQWVSKNITTSSSKVFGNIKFEIFKEAKNQHSMIMSIEAISSNANTEKTKYSVFETWGAPRALLGASIIINKKNATKQNLIRIVKSILAQSDTPHLSLFFYSNKTAASMRTRVISLSPKEESFYGRSFLASYTYNGNTNYSKFVFDPMGEASIEHI